MFYDLAIIGGGPAGVAAGVYAARKRLKTVFLTKDFGGQSTESLDVQNWIGTVSIPGVELAANFKNHLEAYAKGAVDIKDGLWVESVEKAKDGFSIKTSDGDFSAKTVLIATGSTRRKLDAKNAVAFENKGLTYCASCDGPLFSDKDVLVVGGGNSAFESAAQLLAYCKSVTMFIRGENFRADEITVQKVSANPKFKLFKNARVAEVKGEKFVSSIVYENTKTGETKEMPMDGIFVEIGLIPSTDFVKNLVKLDQWAHIIVDPRTQRTSVAGVWAAGDSTDGLYHQNNIAAGDAVKALEDIYLYLHAK